MSLGLKLKNEHPVGLKEASLPQRPEAYLPVKIFNKLFIVHSAWLLHSSNSAVYQGIPSLKRELPGVREGEGSREKEKVYGEGGRDLWKGHRVCGKPAWPHAIVLKLFRATSHEDSWHSNQACV